MALEGIHHITAVTGDAQANVDFYAGVMGLRMIKQTVNFDDPSAYHLYFADELASAGAALTFFEYPGAAPGLPGAGMVHTIIWRVASADAIDFWKARLRDAEMSVLHEGDTLTFCDPEGLAYQLVVDDTDEPPLSATASDVPAEFALRGFGGVRAYAQQPENSAELLTALGFEADGGERSWVVGGEQRSATLAYDEPPLDAARPGAGTVHHVAWSAADDEELDLCIGEARGAGAQPTGIIDRQYFHSIYFREPSGVLFEIATRDVGFTVDEPLDQLGMSLRLPEQYEQHREQIELNLTALVNPRASS
ncbi:MAG: VOC family protein [Actinomycetes bacterium]